MTSYEANASLPPIAVLQSGMLIGALRVFVIVIALLLYAALSIKLITDSESLFAYTVLLLGHLYVEARTLRVRDPRLFWINPVVLASLFTFVLAFGVSNAIYFLREDVVALVGLHPIATPWMSQLMLLVVLGACAMWVGYGSSVGRNIGQRLQRSRLLRKYMKVAGRINMPALYVCLALSLLARLAAIRLGVYGYSSDYDELIAGANYRQYLSMAESLGKLALIAVATQRFASTRPSFSDRGLLWLVLGFEVAFGFLSGFKSAVVIPVIIVGIVYYAQRARFPRWLAPAVMLSVWAAYAIIEPFRLARNLDPGFVGTDLGSIVTTMVSASNVQVDDDVERASLGLSFLARSNLTYVASLGIEFAANNDLPAESPEFLSNIILAPAHALIPRVLWGSKPLENAGLWYTNQVMGYDFYSSTAMSPFTYLNFAGGPFAVVVGFWFVGVLQRGLFDGFKQFGHGGLIVLFGLLGTLVKIDNAFNAFVIEIIRFLPILVITQHVLLLRRMR